MEKNSDTVANDKLEFWQFIIKVAHLFFATRTGDFPKQSERSAPKLPALLPWEPSVIQSALLTMAVRTTLMMPCQLPAA